MKKSTLLLACFILLISAAELRAQRAIFVEQNAEAGEFQTRNSELPQWELIPTGVGRDGIPAIDKPAFTDAKRAGWLEPTDRVIGVYVDGTAKAYPLRILAGHEVVNDDVAGGAVAVTYSPLCGSAAAYRTENGDDDYQLASAGLVYNNNPLFFDRQTESLWLQLLGRATAGRAQGMQLERVATVITTWEEWKSRHPGTKVLSRDTGFERDYTRNNYDDYATSDQIFFPLTSMDNRLALKQAVIGLELDGRFRAYPLATLAKLPAGQATDQFNGVDVFIDYLPDARTAYLSDAAGNALPTVTAYWFAWSALHPGTDIFETTPLKSTMSMMGALEE